MCTVVPDTIKYSGVSPAPLDSENDVTSILSVIELSMLAEDGAHVLPETCHVFTTSLKSLFDRDGLILPGEFESIAIDEEDSCDKGIIENIPTTSRDINVIYLRRIIM